MKLDKLINSAGKGVEIASVIGASEATACRRIANPYSITLGEIIKLIKAELIDADDLITAIKTETRRKTK